VKTGFASTPLGYLANTGTSGSENTITLYTNAIATANTTTSTFATCTGNITLGTETIVTATANVAGTNSSVTTYDPLPAGTYKTKVASEGNVITFNFSGIGTNYDYRFVRNRGGVITDLAVGTTQPATLNYTILPADVSAPYCIFSVIVSAGD
jgi:hypothetical protein